MKICVAGLGIIGGSVCLALKRAGLSADGWNRSEEVLNYALDRGIIDGAASDFSVYDVVFVALPPEATVEFINGTAFKDGAVVSDICGVKVWLEKQIFARERNFSYIGCHPMAGKEVSGIKNACADLFDNASMIITENPSTDKRAKEIISGLTKAMGFKRIVECSAEVHDRKIAYTSQLAHVVSNAYVKDGEIDGCLGFTGGSFQDMTRIAGVDEKMWSSLFMKNRENLSNNLQTLIHSLNEIKEAIDGGNTEKLSEVLACGRKIALGNRKTNAVDNIKIINLK